MATFIAGAGVAMSQTTQEQIDALEEQILRLQQQVENGGAQPNFLNQAAAQGLQFNFYGQITWQSGGGSTKADAYRYVLIPSYKLSDYAKFISEFELEHGGLKDGDNDRFSGALELEQMYIDVNVNEYVNWRSLGVSLIPVGEINQYHEPIFIIVNSNECCFFFRTPDYCMLFYPVIQSFPVGECYDA